ncbi:terminase large subunit domain-containing protein [Mycobacteroides salmoniphilum]|uniref:terminase large subunit domain-containing protein n=1 Tax=Mycobacteroides salmoniphilum TaxID=404941 RepID=UPI0010656867|nr:terminase family protein [Mycobacteroides salmoniphilum]TDZ77069.1 Terminase-like family protein [Mycobacteroides salmoniphilum]TDZ86772.1 Terminase-like family protein [Mycobacteroides salmoniphilum]
MTTATAMPTLAATRALAEMRSRRRPQTPAELAVMLDPKFVVTPTIRLLSDELVAAVEQPDARLIVTTPPRTGKSTLVSRIFPVWLLMRDPDAEVILKSYGDQLAEEHSAAARALITEHSATLGFTLAEDKKSVGRWRVDGRRGGMLAGGILSTTTGFGASYLIVDDPVKGAQEADSDAYRRRLVNEFRASLMTRLMPGGSAIVVLTRWHEQDIAGSLLAEPDSRWRCVNIPAIATSGVPDALGRRPGVPLTSANGFTLERFTEIKTEVGSRQWAALYLGTPTSPEGGLIKREWVDSHRLIAASRRPTLTVVGVDPAESGEGDETGIVAGQVGRDGQIALTHNISAHLTSEGWVNRAVELAVAIGASRIVVEGYSAATTYTRLLREAVERTDTGHQITVTTWPPKGQARKGDSLSRAQGLIAALETGRCRIAGQLPDLEADMLGWEAGQHQPDSVAAATIVFETLAATAGAQITIAAPIGRLSGSGGLAAVVPINSVHSPWARRISGR